MSDVYEVKKKDTLGKISKATGVSVKELMNLNHLPDPNKLKIGQVLMLHKKDVLGVQALVLDKDRNPVRNQPYHFEFGGMIMQGVTGLDGLTKKIMTISPHDEVKIFIERLDKSMKEIATVTSGYGNKLVTLVSPSIKVEAKTEKHPDVKPGKLPDKKEKVQPIYPPKQQQPPTTGKKDLGPKTTPTKTPDGKPLTKVEGDIPNVDFLDEYNGEEMTDADYVWAAKELGVEKAAIKAFATVESGGSGFLKIGKKTYPKILYERHKFAKFTKNKYSAKYPDISLPVAYYNADTKYVLADAEYKKKHNVPDDVEYYRDLNNKKDSKETKDSAVKLEDMLKSGAATAEKDKYLAGLGSYKRLLKAYQLDPEAALKCCSWGAFQILGEYWSVMQYKSAQDFTKCVSRSSKEQIKTFVNYIKFVNPAIKKYLKDHDWEEAAKAYNGAAYKKYHYDEKLEKAYKKFKDEA
jgi:murein DD-endopeptidase MepM/ murein hydrolase activator NlpD